QVVGGTSAGTPQWSAMIALIDQGRALIGLSSLDGPTQALPEIKGLPSSDFNVITGAGLTGAGSPIGEKIISALVGDNITSVHDIGTQLIFSQQPTNRTAGADFSPAITVQIEDADGNVVAADDSNVTLSVSSGPGALTGTATVTAVNGIATFSNLALDTSGTYTLTASDDNLAGITSNSFTVSPAAASQLVIIHQPTTVIAGATISPAVTVDIEDQFGNLITTNTSMVTLAVNTGPGLLGGNTAVAAVNGVATFGNLSLGTAGAYTLKATDGSLASATSTGFTVNPVATTTALAASSNVIAAGQVVAFIATVTAASGSPTGTVTFMDGSTPIGTANINSTTHKAVAFTNSLPMGLNGITATYNASGAFATSSASLSETVTAPIVTTTSLVSSTNPATTGQVVAFTATVSAASGSATGTVTFMDGSTLIGTVALNATTHQAVAFTRSLPIGSNTIIAIYNAGGGFVTSSTSMAQAVNAVTTTTVATSTNPITFGQVVAFTATVSSPSGSPVGSVTFTDGSTLIGTVAVDPITEQAVAFTGSLPTGSNKITATYNGAAGNGAGGFSASSASLTETVNQGIPTTTTVIASSATIQIGQAVAITATVTAASGSPTGTVTFMDGSTLIGTVNLNPTTHQAVAFTLSLPAGLDNLIAIYNGDGQFSPSSSSVSESVESA
ncbi:MAG TPA: Ig-like domain repeat protein, partial [Tepidisphaeraceae bacterium]